MTAPSGTNTHADTRLPDDTVCACLSETGSRQVEIVERCVRCGACMYSDAYEDSLAEVERERARAEAAEAERDRVLARADREFDAGVETVRDALDEERARADRAEAALRRIQEWDCLNPPNSDLCYDHPWLRRLVDDALSAGSGGRETT